MTEKTLVLLNKSFFSYIRLRRVILLRSDIRLMPSDIALWAVKNYTENQCGLLLKALRKDTFAHLQKDHRMMKIIEMLTPVAIM